MTEPTQSTGRQRQRRTHELPPDFHPEDTRPEGAKEADAYEEEHSAASNLFDLRYMIGGLFTVYGLMLTIAGFFMSSAEISKAAGLNINLWLGIGMLILGILFLIWGRLSPVRPAQTEPRDVNQDRPVSFH